MLTLVLEMVIPMMLPLAVPTCPCTVVMVVGVPVVILVVQVRGHVGLLVRVSAVESAVGCRRV